MVRSFSRVDPFPQGLRRDNETYVFLKWIATLAPLLVADTFTEDTWRSARPWMDFTMVRRCHYKYLETSLGSIKAGKHVVTDAMVAKAVTYEKAITRIFDHSDAETVVEIIRDTYEPCLRKTTLRTDILKTVNAELLARGKNAVAPSSLGWRNAMSQLGISGASTQFQRVALKPRKNCADEFVQVLHLYYKSARKKIPFEDLRDTIALYLSSQCRDIKDHELSVVQAVRKTTLWLKPRTETRVAYIEKYFAPVLGFEADRKSIVDVVNEKFVPHPHDHPVWDIVFSQIKGAESLAPRIGVDYQDIILHAFEYDAHATMNVLEVQKYVHERVGDLFQLPFFRAAIRRVCKHKHTLVPMRKRKHVPWDNIVHMHCKRGKSKHTVPFLNVVLTSMGFTPYHRNHTVWEYVHAKGVQPKWNLLDMIRKSCTVTQRRTPRKEILEHLNVTYNTEFTLESVEWQYAMTHFKDGDLRLVPN